MSKTENKDIVLAICYDFDKTLSPNDMQAQGYIQSVGYDVEQFWKESNGLAHEHEMDQNLAYMYKMMTTSRGKFVFTKKTLEEYGAKVTLFPGVETWFERINQYGAERGITVEHYIISSGLKEMIEGTSIAKAGVFTKIYASSFYFDGDGVAVWPAQAINYTNKTQFLFRIQKGTLDINDAAVNDHFDPEDMRVPFRNMIYIGDSDTDIPCMKLVNSYGGHSVGVYDFNKKDKTKVYKMIRDGRIKYYSPADYSEGTELDNLVKSIIDRTVANERLELIGYSCKKEYLDFDSSNSEDDKNKWNLINDLGVSKNFERTHALIKELQAYPTWTVQERELLYEIALSVHSVRYILTDIDVKLFYNTLLKCDKKPSEKAKKVRERLNE